MNGFATLLTVSLAGSALLAALLLLSRLHGLRRTAVYYLYALVLLRLALPFGLPAVVTPAWQARAQQSGRRLWRETLPKRRLLRPHRRRLPSRRAIRRPRQPGPSPGRRF